MEFIVISPDDFDGLKRLQTAYKREIGEEEPAAADFDRLLEAIGAERIIFYGAAEQGQLIACCSVSPTFSTFDYRKSGVFEDFYVAPAYRHQGVARRLVEFAIRQSGVSTLTVGCADCDADMYKALGFSIPIGNLLAYDG